MPQQLASSRSSLAWINSHMHWVSGLAFSDLISSPESLRRNRTDKSYHNTGTTPIKQQGCQVCARVGMLAGDVKKKGAPHCKPLYNACMQKVAQPSTYRGQQAR